MGRYVIYSSKGQRAGVVQGNDVTPADTPAGQQLAKWLASGVPALKPRQAGPIITEMRVIIKPTDLHFWWAVVSHFDEIGWVMKKETPQALRPSAIRAKRIPSHMYRGKSYFSECPRDDHGHCLPKGDAGHVKQEKPKKQSSAGRSKTIADLAQKYPDLVAGTKKGQAVLSIENDSSLYEAMIEAGYEDYASTGAYGTFHIPAADVGKVDDIITGAQSEETVSTPTAKPAATVAELMAKYPDLKINKTSNKSGSLQLEEGSAAYNALVDAGIEQFGNGSFYVHDKDAGAVDAALAQAEQPVDTEQFYKDTLAAMKQAVHDDDHESFYAMWKKAEGVLPAGLLDKFKTAAEKLEATAGGQDGPDDDEEDEADGDLDMKPLYAEIAAKQAAEQTTYVDEQLAQYEKLAAAGDWDKLEHLHKYGIPAELTDENKQKIQAAYNKAKVSKPGISEKPETWPKGDLGAKLAANGISQMIDAPNIGTLNAIYDEAKSNIEGSDYEAQYKQAIEAAYQKAKDKLTAAATVPALITNSAVDTSSWPKDDANAKNAAQYLASLEKLISKHGDIDNTYVIDHANSLFGDYADHVIAGSKKLKQKYQDVKAAKDPSTTSAAVAAPLPKNKFVDTSSWPAHDVTAKWAAKAISLMESVNDPENWDIVQQQFALATHNFSDYNTNPYLQEVGKAYQQLLQEKVAKSKPLAAADLTYENAKKPLLAHASAGSVVTHPQMQDWETESGSLGNTPGGKFKAPDGKQYYVKFSKTALHAQNEVLAAQLYALAGAAVPDYGFVTTPDGKLATASPWIETAETADYSNPLTKEAAVDAFASHVWLANWDAIGNGGYKNQMWVTHPDGSKQLVTMDLGGSMLFGGLGGKKNFTPDVTEFDNYLNPSMNKEFADVFSGMTPQQLLASCQKVAAISDEAIKAMLDKVGPSDPAVKKNLLDVLIARRNAVAAKAEEIKKSLIGSDKPTVDTSKLPAKPKANDDDINIKLGQLEALAANGNAEAIEQSLAQWKTEPYIALKVEQYGAALLDALAKQSISPAAAAPTPGDWILPPKPSASHGFEHAQIESLHKLAMAGDLAALEAYQGLDHDPDMEGLFIEAAKYKDKLVEAVKQQLAAGLKPPTKPAAPTSTIDKSKLPPMPATGSYNAKIQLEDLQLLAEKGDLAGLEAYQGDEDSAGLYATASYYKTQLVKAVKDQLGDAATAPSAAPAAPAAKKPLFAVPPQPSTTNKFLIPKYAKIWEAAASGSIAAVEAIEAKNDPKLPQWQKVYQYKMAVLSAMKNGGMVTGAAAVAATAPPVAKSPSSAKPPKPKAPAPKVEPSKFSKVPEFEDATYAASNTTAATELYELAKKGDMDGLQAHAGTPSPKLKEYKNQLISELDAMLNPPPPPVPFTGTLSHISKVYQNIKQATEKIGSYMVTENVGVPNVSWPVVKWKAGGGKKLYSLSDAALDAQMTKAYKSMSLVTQKMLRDYTASSGAINAAFRAGEPSAKHKEFAKEMIAKAPLLPPGLQWDRKLNLYSNQSKMFSTVGKVLQEPAPQSSTIDPGTWSGDSTIFFTAGEGVRGLYVGGLSLPNSGEEEIVLPPGTRFLVTKVENVHGKTHIHAIVMPTLPDQCC